MKSEWEKQDRYVTNHWHPCVTKYYIFVHYHILCVIQIVLIQIGFVSSFPFSDKINFFYKFIKKNIYTVDQKSKTYVKSFSFSLIAYLSDFMDL